MRIAYVTHDDVNAFQAAQEATRTGIGLVLTRSYPSIGVDAVVYDLDFLPSETFARLLSDDKLPAGQIAVHSYNLDAAQQARLRQHGIVVSRRLDKRLFACLRDAALVQPAMVADSVEPPTLVDLLAPVFAQAS